MFWTEKMAYAKALGWKEFLLKKLKRGVSGVEAGKRKARRSHVCVLTFSLSVHFSL